MAQINSVTRIETKELAEVTLDDLLLHLLKGIRTNGIEMRADARATIHLRYSGKEEFLSDNDVVQLNLFVEYVDAEIHYFPFMSFENCTLKQVFDLRERPLNDVKEKRALGIYVHTHMAAR